MATATATPNVPTSTGDDGTLQPPSDRPFGFVFNPTDPDIIHLLRCKINNLPVVGDMVNPAPDLYKISPDNLVKGLHQYIVDGIPHYLAFTKTEVMQQHSYNVEGISKIVGEDLKGYWEPRSIRNVGEDMKGCWKPRGERCFITDKFQNVVGSKVHFTYHDGHFRKKDKGIQGSAWNMIEYRIVSETKNADHLKYTICKLHTDSASKDFQEQEAKKKLVRKLRDEILTLEHRGGGWNHRGVVDMLRADINSINSSTTNMSNNL